MPNPSGRVQGKVAIVTGAASGLGAASARRLAEEGACVMLTDRAVAEGEKVAESILTIGGKAAFMAHDVTLEDDWSAVVAATLKAFGRLDILVNNAGVSGGGSPLMEQTLENWRGLLAINLDGVFLGMRAAGAAMAETGGSIINLSSILGKVGQAGAGAYCASKGGVLMLTKAAAVEWAPLKIRVNSIHPGYIDTPMVSGFLHEAENSNELREMIINRHPLGRLGLAREIADGVVFLASDEASFMTGSELVIDGGYTAQ
jgi:NAD(P)-dependent dehydrogenase (short-subunit alcohol dehydrogenase family)